MTRKYGHLFGTPDARDKPVSSLVGARRAASVRPQAVTYEHLVAVQDQEQTNSCEAHAWGQALFVRAAIVGEPIPFPSRAALYALAVEIDQGGGALADHGTYARSIGLALTRDGVCSEKVWPFDKLLTAVGTVSRPPWDVLQASGDARVSAGAFAAVQSTGAALCEDLRDALAKGYVITFGTQVDQAFEDGRFETYGGLSGPSLGGHALCLVGYEPGRFRAVNSWGTEWNDGGLFWISDGALQAPACSDFFALDVAPRVAA